jgi:plastocyanin
MRRPPLLVWPALAATCGALAASTQYPWPAYAAETHIVVQKDRSFSVDTIAVAVGDTIQFTNNDDFIHQIYSDTSKIFNFDTNESEPGNSILIKFTTAGTFEVHCHIHPKMGLVVTVK